MAARHTLGRSAAFAAALMTWLAMAAVPAATADTPSLTAELVVGGLDRAAAFTIDDEGRIYYGERLTGQIRVFDPATDEDVSFFTIPDVVATAGSSKGLLGLALHPRRPFVYAYVTRDVGGGVRIQIVRVEIGRDGGGEMEEIHTLRGRAGEHHVGGRILFGPDEMLYAVVGERQEADLSQDLSSERGKVLRMTQRGQVPDDNPFPDSRVWAYGIRNSFGFAFDPATGRMWETGNGPECNDELNLIKAGRNYGWGPNATCDTPPDPPANTNQDGPDPVMPRLWWTPNIAPTGAAFCEGCGLNARGHLFVGGFNTEDVRMIRLRKGRANVRRERVVYEHSRFVLSLEAGPDGTLHFTDGEAIFRVVPA